MLPRSRIVSVLLLGLGAALIVAGLALPRLLDAEPRVPLNLPDTTLRLHAEDAVTARMGEDGEVEEVRSPVRRQFHAEFIEPADEDTVSLRVGTSMTREGPEAAADPLRGLVTANVWTFTVDRLTGLPTGPATLNDQPLDVREKVDMGGSWAKFPAGAGERDYPVFDEVLRGPVTAGFVAAEEREGHRVLHYRQEIAEVDVATRYQGMFTDGVLDGRPVHLEYSGTRDWWVEPVTGLIVDLAEDLDARWVDESGETVAVAMDFTGEMPRGDAEAQLRQAVAVADTPAPRPWGIALAVIGAILAAVGLFGALRPGAARGTGAER